MDEDRARAFRKTIEPNSPDPAEMACAAEKPEWRGTGLCPSAQADGVPCHELGRSCDLCGRASKDLLPSSPPVPEQPRKAVPSHESDEKDGLSLLDRAGL